MLVMPEIRFSWTNIVSPLENLIVRYPVISALLGTGQQENRALAYARCYFLASGMTVGDVTPLYYPELRLIIKKEAGDMDTPSLP